jgi:hypothetical protein
MYTSTAPPPALVRRRVLRPVPLAAVRRHFAPATLDICICSFLAPRVVADPSQFFAKALVLGHVLYGVVLAAVQRHSAPGALLESFAELQVRGARLARRYIAAPGLLLSSLGAFGEVGAELAACAANEVSLTGERRSMQVFVSTIENYDSTLTKREATISMLQ